MKELHAIIPDPDAVLALEPEELAGKLLFFLRTRNVEPWRPLSVQDLVSELVYEDRPKGVEGYPQDRWQELSLAVAEALAWLEAQGLLIPHPQHGPGYSALSRRARRFESEEDFRQFGLARQLNRDLLHPMIAEEVWLSVSDVRTAPSSNHPDRVSGP